MTRFGKYFSEIRISGRVAVGGSETVLGRIRFFDEAYTEGSILCVRENEKIDRDTLLLCPPLAVIVFCYDGAGSLGEVCSLGVPCLVFDENEVTCGFCKNKIALIDVQRGILILDPSIDTLAFYSAMRNRSSLVYPECPRGRILENLDIAVENAEYYFASSTILEKSEIFESAITLSERLHAEFLFFDVSVPMGAEREERIFSETVEELYRAALYGSFAISLSGFDCEGELAHAMRLFHKVFCILEAEGREFNAYLPRGITISSPLWLMRSCPVTNPDFIIFDFDSILLSFFSIPHEKIIQKEKELKKELFLVLERYFLNFFPRCDVYFKAKFFSNTFILRELVSFANAKAVFC